MKWIYANNLEYWAEREILSRTNLSELVSSLIRASVPRPAAFQFPTGDSAQMHGYDGILESEGAPPFVPAGDSVWEFSTEADLPGKPNRDYKARTTDPRGRQPANTTFVFVTPRRWEDADKWVAQKKAEKKWKDVRVIHAVNLEEWLEQSPAVASRIASDLLGLIPANGARSAEEFWQEYASRFEPTLTEQVLIAGRSDQATQLLQQLQGVPQAYMYQADSLDEAVAFAVAAIRLAESNQRKYLEARTLVLDTKEAARQLANRSDLIFFLRGSALELSALLGKRTPTLVPVGRDRTERGANILRRPHFDELAESLKTMGFLDARAGQLARECGRSVTILSRRITSATGQLPRWREDRRLIPAILAGAWSTRSEEDLKIVASLTDDQSFPAYEKILLPYTGMSEDHPLEREGDLWTMRAPVDAFVLLAYLVASDDLAKFRNAVQTVFSEPDPTLELPEDERYYAGLSGKKMKHSGWLRSGLATTLLLMAEFHEEARFQVTGMTPQQFVDNVIRNLPGLVTDYKAVSNLHGILPTIAEAAPRPLLDALDQLIEGDGRKILPIFQDKKTDWLGSSSPHTALLWALEILSWDPSYLSEATLILARLARIDPGGTLANRPNRSLREIFLVWHPSTNASLDQRLAAVDQIVRLEPAVGWELLLALLPEFQGIASPTAKPRYREAGASKAEPVTYASIARGYKQIVERVLAHVGRDPRRWSAVIRQIPSFSPQDRERAVAGLEDFAKSLADGDTTQVWDALRSLINRHRRFETAAWAMQGADLQRLEDVLALLQPQDPLTQIAWLFNDYHPDLPDVKLTDQWNEIQSRRTRAVLLLHDSGGVKAVLDLASRVKLPQHVGFAFANGAELAQIEALINVSLRDGKMPGAFEVALSAGADSRFKMAWRSRIKELYDQGSWNSPRIGALVLSFPNDLDTWLFIQGLCTKVEDYYWTNKMAGPVKADEDALEFMATHYLHHGRALAALESVWYSGGAASSSTLFKLLDAAVEEINSNPDSVSTNLTFEIEQILKSLRARVEIPRVEVAKREYAYLPLLQFQEEALTIHSLLAEDPDLFVSVLCDVFKPSRGPDREATEAARNKARAGFSLLSEFKILPGLKDGYLDETFLKEWILKARELGAARDRAEITEEYIGHVLAYAPSDLTDQAWPHRGVRDLIEYLASKQVELGIRIERFNMRGTTVRGPFEGGGQERSLAATIRQWAEYATSWPRTANLLREMAAEWEHHAEQEDLRAKQDEIRFS